MMPLKKIFLNLTIIAIIVFVLDFAIGKTLRYFYFKQTSGYQYRTTYAFDETKADILIFGSSRANHHYVPGIFEDSLKMTFYNTGRDGNGTVFETAILRSVLKRYTPKIVVFDFYGDFKKDADPYDWVPSLLPYYRTHKEIRDLILKKNPLEKIKLISEIYPFNSQILSIGIGNLKINQSRNTDDKGYVPLYTVWQYEKDSVEDNIPYDVDHDKVIAFQELIRLAKKSGTRVFVVFSPLYKKFNTIQELDICRDICLTENIPFYDLSKDSLFTDNKIFRDDEHLNHTGALLFSGIITHKISQHIKSHPSVN
jgi:hypothetical protein